MDHKYANQLFLLALIAPLGCDSDPEPGNTGVVTTQGATGDGGMDTTGGANDTAGDDDDGPGPADDTGADTSADTGADADTSAETGADTGVEADTGSDADTGFDTGSSLYCDEPPAVSGEISQLCVDYEAWSANCFFDGELPEECAEYYAAYCQFLLEEYETNDGPACLAAMEELFACINGLTCREYGTLPIPCPEQVAAAEAVCPSTEGE